MRDAHLHRHLGSTLQQARVAAGLTQRQVADSLKLPQSFVSKYETGDRSISPFDLIRIARALRIDTSTLTAALEEIVDRG
jgi:transcriptional regulator with XRE-family HTH domain